MSVSVTCIDPKAIDKDALDERNCRLRSFTNRHFTNRLTAMTPVDEAANQRQNPGAPAIRLIPGSALRRDPGRQRRTYLSIFAM